MSAFTPNPLLSSQKSSELHAVLHPLVLLTISDYITRHTLRNQDGPIVGALLGQQNGREITIEHAIEAHVREAPEVQGGYLLHPDKFGSRIEQMITVHKDRQLDLVGWYTLLPSSGPTETVLPIHNQILADWNESAVLLGFHPAEVLDHSVGGKLPLTIYESNYEVDDPSRAAANTNTNDGEDKNMDDGEQALKLKFRELPYSVETDETEMISMNYVAGAGGNATAVAGPNMAAAAKDDKPALSLESNGKGKRRLVESEDDSSDSPTPAAAAAADDDEEDVPLTIEEDETIAALTTKANAIKMLHSRIRLLTAYLERLPPSYLVPERPGGPDVPMDADYTTPSQTVLRQIQALVSRLDLVIPSDQDSFGAEMLREANDVNLVSLLNDIMQNTNQAREVGKKYNIIENAKVNFRRGGQEYPGEPNSYGSGLRSAGDLLM